MQLHNLHHRGEGRGGEGRGEGVGSDSLPLVKNKDNQVCTNACFQSVYALCISHNILAVILFLLQFV